MPGINSSRPHGRGSRNQKALSGALYGKKSRPHGRGSRNETDDITLAAHFGHAHTGVGVEIIGHQERAIRRYRHAHTGVGVEITVR